MYGRCETKWNKKTKRSDVCKGSEDYCQQELLLWGCGLYSKILLKKKQPTKFS